MSFVGAVRHQLEQRLQLALGLLPLLEVDRPVGEEPLLVVAAPQLRLRVLETLLRLRRELRLRLHRLKVVERLLELLHRRIQVAVLDLAVVPPRARHRQGLLGHGDEPLAGLRQGPDAELVLRESLQPLADRPEGVRLLGVDDAHRPHPRGIDHAETPGPELRRAGVDVLVAPAHALQGGVGKYVAELGEGRAVELLALLDVAPLARHVVHHDAEHAVVGQRERVAEDVAGVGLDLLVGELADGHVLLRGLPDHGLLARREHGRQEDRRERGQDYDCGDDAEALRAPGAAHGLVVAALARRARPRAEAEVHRVRRRGRCALADDAEDGRADLDQVARPERRRPVAELASVHESPVSARQVGDAHAVVADRLEEAVVARELLVGHVDVVGRRAP